MVDSSDERDFRRMSVQCEATFRRVGQQPTRRGAVDNLSAAGLLLICDEPLQPGDQIEVTIQAAGGRAAPYRAIVDVVRVDVGAGGTYRAGCSTRELLS